MTFESISSTLQVFTGQFPDEPYRAHSPKLEPSRAEVGQAQCLEHRPQYTVVNDESTDKFSVTIPKMLRLDRKSTLY